MLFLYDFCKENLPQNLIYKINTLSRIPKIKNIKNVFEGNCAWGALKFKSDKRKGISIIPVPTPVRPASNPLRIPANSNGVLDLLIFECVVLLEGKLSLKSIIPKTRRKRPFIRCSGKRWA